ncbi:L,D-transpeptidase [Oceanomicrobium pacificus]|uniref:L,D-transpeptidase family protein n=1 Tax=Oceanomicrobium pacificus TaxID=2692916 RepID=A0A6B0TW31_9RHOB|nr:L,D-transpeptidase [Oceanomicrobium pacificus]MXU65955.1 L,D-transpeptidase family protein [Oceanomicrobium pacificus]
MLTRRHFIVTSAALFSGPIAGPALAQQDTVLPTVEPPAAPARGPVSNPNNWPRWDSMVTPANYDPATSNPWGIHPRFLANLVEARPSLRAGDLHVDAVARYIYYINGDGTAMRYGVAIAKGNLYEPGTYRIGRKARWPTWTPTANMIRREPEVYKQYENGMDGGPSNPLGSRAFYLYSGGRDTYLRIHGTPYARSIGGRASSGCVRMVMAHINGLYDRVSTGSTAYLYPPEDNIGRG